MSFFDEEKTKRVKPSKIIDKERGRRIVIYLSKILSGKKNVEVGIFLA